MTKESKQKLVDLLVEYGLTEAGARERSNNIMQAVGLVPEIEWTDIHEMLSPSTIYEYISDPVSRAQAATEWLRIYREVRV